MNETAYFSWENFQELVDLDSHISFVSRLIGKYQWEAKVKKSFEVQLAKIIAKQKDKQLNLSVIGEFSTGKSTFINALIRDNLLVSSALQGTTVANTVLEYSPVYAIHLQYLKGKTGYNEYADVACLRKGLEEVTTDPEIARNLYAVRVGLPSDNLKTGMRIIDTPGTNALELWHEEVTKTALHDLSDLSIILVDATRPLPETLCNFIEANLTGILHQCAFVVTKLDLLPRKEHTAMIGYIQSKLSLLLERDDFLVLPYVAPQVIETFEKGFVKMPDKDYQELSFKNEETVIRYMARQRMKAQAQKLIALVQEMYDNISVQIHSLNEKFNEELAVLIKSQQTDLEPFIAKQKAERLRQYNTAVQNDRTAAVNSFYASKAKAKSRIISTIDSKKSIDDMKNYVHNSLPADCKSNALEIIKSGEEKHKAPKKCFKTAMSTFQKEFEKHFRDLRILQVSFNGTAYRLPTEVEVKTSNLSGAASYTAEELSKENWTAGGAMATGAVIGTAILPGIGSAIGFLAGMFASFFITPDWDKVRDNLKTKLNAPLDSYFNGVVGNVISAYDGYTNSLGQNIAREIDRYWNTYKDTVKAKIREQNKAKAEVEAKIRKLQQDLNEIGHRRYTIESIAAQMKA